MAVISCRSAVLPALVLAFVFACPHYCLAVIRTVTDLGDTTPGGAPGQLRFEINAAAPGDTIVIPAGTITLAGEAGEDDNAGGDLDITESLTIQGAGEGMTIIDGGGIDRVFDIIFADGVSISGMTIRNGKETDEGFGGGVDNFAGSLTLSNVSISGNSADLGGGIENFSGTLTLSNVTISNNTAGVGGGIENFSGTLTLSNVSISGNSADLGGGIENEDTATLSNVTISGNSADLGGGIENEDTATLSNVTISNNTAGVGGGIENFSGTLTLSNVTISNNTAGVGGNCSGFITSLGHNLDSGTTCGFTGPGDLSNTDPLLGPLANNGGPTQTHALLPGSPAIDGGDNVGCPPLDQRGFVRPVDGDGNSTATCDIGAYELVSIGAAVLAAVLPASRSVQVGSAASAFATVLNLGPGTATGCRLAPVPPLPASFLYQTTNPATNTPTGTPNTPVDIAPSGGQSFVFAFTPTGAIPPTDVQLSFACTNTAPAPITIGLNTLLLSASETPVPDLIALAATPSNDGILTLASGGAFALATVNVGAGGLLTVSADTGAVSLPVNLVLCQTNPVTAACLAPATPTVTVQIDANATPTFSIFVGASGPIAFDPATNRIFVRFTDSGSIVRGATSVAVRTP